MIANRKTNSGFSAWTNKLFSPHIREKIDVRSVAFVKLPEERGLQCHLISSDLICWVAKLERDIEENCIEIVVIFVYLHEFVH